MGGSLSLDFNNITTDHLGHFGLISSTIHRIGLIDKINKLLPLSPSHSKLSMGHRSAAMIINGLGFMNTTLYLHPVFFSNKPVSKLLGGDFSPSDFNDDSLGRCLDAIADFGVNKFFTSLAFDIASQQNLFGKSCHIDSTTLSLYGDYLYHSDDFPHPSFGYAKNKRNDLKQMVLSVATTGAAGFPIFMEAHSGNSSDQNILVDAANRIKSFSKSFKNVPDFIYVGDSAIYNNIIPFSNSMSWLSRVPSSISKAKSLLSTSNSDISWIDLPNGYKYSPYHISHKGVDQRWILIFSPSSHKKELNTLLKNIDKEYLFANKQLWHLSNKSFSCSSDSHKALKSLLKTLKLKYHSVEYKVEEEKAFSTKGRPSKNKEHSIKYKIEYRLKKEEERIEKEKNMKGRFILGTNAKVEELKDEEVLETYREQGQVERGFKFIKDNAFEVSSVFLKSPKRINALMAIMTLCLMVYGISQHHMREHLKKKEETIPNLIGKEVKKPSMKMIYTKFINVQILKAGKRRRVTNMNKELERIVKIYGEEAIKIYEI